jgi:hypothetical protein
VEDSVSLRLIASARPRVHHDALDWARRVAANGGSVSQATLRAVSTFCDAIDRAAIRDRFFRLNLFCGSNLSACLVPLYRGPSLGGTQRGRATDANVNFVAGDYSESNGLTGNGSTKYLQTDLPASALATGGNIRSHLSVYKRTEPNSGVLVSSRPLFAPRAWELGAGGNGLGDNNGAFPAPTPMSSLITVTRTTDFDMYSYRNTTPSAVTTYSAVTLTSNVPFTVFCRNQPSTDTNTYSPGLYSNQTLAAYSIGAGLTHAQVVAYNGAMQAFQAAMQRAIA